jgi:uncharacterized repeat protein (TIGR01451 family)
MRKLLLSAVCLVLNLFVLVSAAAGQVTVSVDAPNFVQFGMGLKYLVTVTNSGASSVGGIVITDNLPTGLSATSLSSNCAGANTVICDIGTLGGGQSMTVAIEVVPLTAPATLSNTATVTGGSSASASTNVISNAVALSVFPISSNPLDVVTSSPAGLNCAAAQDVRQTCLAFFPPNSLVTLTASGPSNFFGWLPSSGTCSGTAPCTLTMTEETRVQAIYVSPVGWFGGSTFSVTGVKNIPFAIEYSDAPVGGMPPYTFSIVSGTLPAGLTASGPGLSRISGTPTVTGTFPLTVQAQDSSLPTHGTATANLNITIIDAPNTQASLLKGQYALLLRAVNDGNQSERAFVGSLTFDGAGGVNGTIERNCNGGCLVRTLPTTGSYSIGSDNRGLVSLDIGQTWAVAVGDVSNGVASAVRLIRFDDITGGGVRGAGELRLQDTGTFSETSMAGTYVFGLTGEDPALNRVVEAGLFSMNSALGISSGTADLNDNGVLTSPSFTGSYTAPTAAGRTTLTLNLAGGATSTMVAYVIDADDLFVMTLDSGATKPVLAGTVRRQLNPGSFVNGSLAGPDVINLQGPSGGVFSSNSKVFMGILTANSAGPTVSISFDSNDNKVIQIQGTESGSYGVASNGRATVNVSAPGSLIAYLAGPDDGYVMTTGADPGFGEIAAQTGGPFTNSSFAGRFFGGDREPASPSGGPVTSSTGLAEACRADFTNDESHTRGSLDYGEALSAGFAVAPSGRLTITFAQGNLVSYLISPTRSLGTVIDPGENHPHIIESGSISLTPAPVLVSIVVSPATATLGVGQTQQYMATAHYSDQSTQDLTSKVSWVSSNLGVAGISPAGLATAAAVGTADILARFGCISSAPITLTVATGSLVVVKNTVGGNSTFTFTGTGTGMPASFQVTTNGNTGSSSTITNLTPGSGYSVSEQSQTGWDLTSATCTNGTPGNITITLGQTTSCTFSNTQRGLARVVKTVNGATPSGAQSFTFQIRQGASTTGAGTTLETATATAGNGGVIDFSTKLVPATTYQVCEQVMPGWMTTLGPPFFTVFNPSGDNSVVCANFTVNPGETKSFAIDNQPPPGGLARGIGFWRNWASCASSKGNQKPVLDLTLQLGDIAIGSLVLHDGDQNPSVASDCVPAVRLLTKQNINTGQNMATDLAFNLAAQLLATKLNVQAGAGVCGAAVNAVNAAQTLLAAISFNGVTHAAMTAAQVSQANSLATTLDMYNNNTLCGL